ncbi:MAG: transposase, partial [Candidatus Latescibacteria bacterium]|nr:transposase [Candidatus Latescibacterota bacterium]
MAKPKSKPQCSFFDADSFSHLLDPKTDGVYLTIKHVIAPLIKDEDYADMYSHLGRRPVSPRTLVLTMLLQFLENLSDRRAARSVRLCLAWKIAIGLALDDPGFHFSDLSEFRDRLEKHNKERAAFDALLEKLEELGLIRKHQKQRLDATHVFGHLRRLSRLECMAESMRLTLKRLADLLEDADFERLAPVDIRELYTDELPTQNMDQQAVRRSLRSAGGHALTLLERVAAHSKSSEFSMLEQIKTLRRIFEQYFEVTPEGASVLKEKTPKGEGKDRVVTPHEVEARWSEKRGKDWVGYKLQVTETADRPSVGADGSLQPAVNFITDIAVTNAAEADAQYTQKAIDRLRRRGLIPEELAVDQAYVSGTHIVEAARKGVLLMGPAAAPNPGAIEMPQELFSIDVSREEAICPQGEKSVYWKKDQKG